MHFFIFSLVFIFYGLITTQIKAAGGPEETVVLADQALSEIMMIPASSIPEHMLASAQGIAIIPNVIKVGFIGGIRRGHGVVIVRDAEGEWSLPQFVVLTGGSVGWQVGIQATDVILVFQTKKSVQGLLSGKFTIGADAAVAAGPVGRNAAAATDERFRAEILSWSRSRGIFAGVSLDGSAIEIDQGAHANYYGTPSSQAPSQMPASAVRLLQHIVALSHTSSQPTTATGTQAVNTLEVLRRELTINAAALNPLLDGAWRQYLSLPTEGMTGALSSRPEDLHTALEHFDRIASTPDYQTLAQRPEFKATHEVLREYTKAVSTASNGQLALPPPPSTSNIPTSIGRQ